MKIGHIDNKIPVAPLNGERKASTAENSPAAAPASAAGAEPAALVELSAAAAALTAADPEGSFDSAKVDRIRQSISDGTYKVNPEAIADKLIANAQDLLGRTQR